MTNEQKQSVVNVVAQANGNLVRLLQFPDRQFENEVDRLILTLRAFRQSSSPHINEETEDDGS